MTLRNLWPSLTPCSGCRKANWLIIYENQYFIPRNSKAESLLIQESIIKGLTRYKKLGTSFPSSFNFGINEDHAENSFWRALKLPVLPYLKNILCGTNKIGSDSPYGIAQCLIDISVCFQDRSPKVKIFISEILSRDECYSTDRLLKKEINTILEYKCTFHRINYIEQEHGSTDNNDTLDPSLFYQDKLYLI